MWYPAWDPGTEGGHWGELWCVVNSNILMLDFSCDKIPSQCKMLPVGGTG